MEHQRAAGRSRAASQKFIFLSFPVLLGPSKYFEVHKCTLSTSRYLDIAGPQAADDAEAAAAQAPSPETLKTQGLGPQF